MPYVCLVNIIRVYGGSMWKIILWTYAAMLFAIGIILVLMAEGCTDFPPQTNIDGVYDHPNDNITIPQQHQE